MACVKTLNEQLTAANQQVAQKDQQIAQMNGYMQGPYTAFQKTMGACYQSLAEAEQRAAKK